MLRRYRSLKKIVYAATILFATILLYAGTSSNDYQESGSKEWVLPMVARQAGPRYHLDTELHEPLHRLPLGPFEEHPLPLVVETLPLPPPEISAEPQEILPNSSRPIADKMQAPKILTPRPVNTSHVSNKVTQSNSNSGTIPSGTLSNTAAQSNINSGTIPSGTLSNTAAQSNINSGTVPPGTLSNTAAQSNINSGFDPAGTHVALDSIQPPAVEPAIAAQPLTDSQEHSEKKIDTVPAAPSHNLPSQNADSSPVAPAQTALVKSETAPPTPKPPLPPTNPQNPLPAQKPPNPPSPPKKPLPDLNKTATILLQRLNHTRTQCQILQAPYRLDSDVYQLPQYNLSYCKIPKAGCTYWEQVVSYLNKPAHELTYLGVRMPFQISKFDIRYTSHFNLPRRDFQKEADRKEILQSTRLLFVRHPLERLWSCYLEKFYLIDFWTTSGVSMKTAGADLKCPKSITFREFIEFTLPLHDENWAPMTELCNPCQFLPDIIGHVETLRDDSYYTLKKMDLEWIFMEHDKFSREENQMLDMTIYNFQLHSIHWYSFYHNCLTQRELAAKLWDVFKKVGYLSSHALLPDNLPDYNQTTIIKELKTQFRKFPLGPTNGRAQQLKMMKRDFDSLPKPTMTKVLERYAMDFQLFGFSTQIPTS